MLSVCSVGRSDGPLKWGTARLSLASVALIALCSCSSGGASEVAAEAGAAHQGGSGGEAEGSSTGSVSAGGNSVAAGGEWMGGALVGGGGAQSADGGNGAQSVGGAGEGSGGVNEPATGGAAMMEGSGGAAFELAPISRLGVYEGGGCAIGASNELTCWGGEEDPPREGWGYPEFQVTSVVGSYGHICVLTTTGIAHCFNGPRGTISSNLPEEAIYSQVASADGIGIGLDANGIVTKAEREGETVESDRGPYLQVGASDAGICGIRASDRGIDCWGISDTEDYVCAPWTGVHNELTPPESGHEYTMIEGGRLHFCALRTDGEIDCWGAGTPGSTPQCDPEIPSHRGQNAPPQGDYSYVSAGDFHSCAVRSADGGIDCWGAGTETGDCTTIALACGMSIPPEETGFVQVAAGYAHTCALKADGKVVCWGAQSKNRSTPPPELQ